MKVCPELELIKVAGGDRQSEATQRTAHSLSECCWAECAIMASAVQCIAASIRTKQVEHLSSCAMQL